MEEIAPPRSTGLGATLDNNAISAELVLNVSVSVPSVSKLLAVTVKTTVP